jgi:RNA polymerase sigma factor (TIGR02999 family)
MSPNGERERDKLDLTPCLHGHRIRRSRYTEPGTLSSTDPQAITDLLRAWGGGSDAALEPLLAVAYDDLRRIARAQLARESPGHTLQPTALVHETYLRLARERKVAFKDRAHFFGACARMMRRILVDHARRRHARKRTPDTAYRLGAVPAATGPAMDAEQLLALDRALEALEALSARQSRIVELRFFGGLSVEETANVLGIAGRTVKLDWMKAKAWLHRELTRGEGSH